MRPLELFLSLALLLTAAVSIARGEVSLSREQALRLAFPEAETIETVRLYLTEEEMAQVARASGARLDSPLHTFYVGKTGGKATGYAAIEAATVRTMPETVMVVLDPDGTVRFVEILAFFEPEEYKPSRRWLNQFPGRKLSPEMRVGGEIQGITGATLSAQAILRQVRRTAALAELLKGRQ